LVVIGVDAHKRTHTLVALDEVGRKLGERPVATTSEGHLTAVEWAAKWTGVRFALEDCRHRTRRLEQDLLAAGHQVARVPTRLMAGARRAGREQGKSDPIDAEAVALAALRHPDLPMAQLDGPTRELKLLVDHRRVLVNERTRLASRIRWYVHELDPSLHIPSRALRRFCVARELLERLEAFDGLVARLARESLQRCLELTDRVNKLEREIRALVRDCAPELLDIPGCGVLSAAMIIGETAGARRFRSAAAYARFNGTAPVPVWSAASGCASTAVATAPSTPRSI
jgi:transposase